MQEFADEVVAGIGRTNYNQNNLQLNALAGLVSLLPSTDPQVFSIKVCPSMLSDSFFCPGIGG